jgi:hypothetical protein
MMGLNLIFDEGRAVIPLADGTALSILNEDRDEVIREARVYSISAIPGTPFPLTRCDAETYEVALTNDEEGGCAGPIPGWEEYDNYDEGEWTTYGYVPESLIEEYVTKVGRKP